jgi:shikimate kinase
MPQLIVITGPIAAGKSSVARGLADRVRDAGRTAVVLDLDDIVATLRVPLQSVEQSWTWARQVHGRLVGEWLASGVETVIVDGPFYTEGETAAMMRYVPNDVGVCRVLLLAPFEIALARVADDPSRGVSKIPSVLHTKYEEFSHVRGQIAAFDWTFGTSACTLDDVVKKIGHEFLAL